MKLLFKTSPKIFLAIIIFSNLFFAFGVSFSLADTATTTPKNLGETCTVGKDTCSAGVCAAITPDSTDAKCVIFAPQVAIPGMDYDKIQPTGTTKPLGEYIKGIYNYGIGIVAILATVVMMIGGFQWIIAGGSGEKIGEAKAWITAALSGLVLALSSYMILSMINPGLVKLQVLEIKPIKSTPEIAEVLCCDSSGGKIESIEVHDATTDKITSKKCPEESSNCDDYCSLREDGDNCSSGGYCISGKCVTTPGKEGEPCGYLLVGVCTLGTEPCGSFVPGGRDCDTTYYCCNDLLK